MAPTVSCVLVKVEKNQKNNSPSCKQNFLYREREIRIDKLSAGQCLNVGYSEDFEFITKKMKTEL